MAYNQGVSGAWKLAVPFAATAVIVVSKDVRLAIGLLLSVCAAA
jgi:hypothetical protein